MSTPFTFYDLRMKRIPASPNTWKTRFTLNYKGLPYKTTFLNFVDIKPTLQALNISPSEGELYTVPAIIDHETGQRISDSFRIAEYLDAQHPETPMLIPPHTREAQIAFEKDVRQPFAFTVFPIILLDFYNDILDEKDKEYFRRTREAQFNASLESVVPKGDQRALQLELLHEGVENIEKEVKKHNASDALFFGGDRPCFADIQLAAFFKSLFMGFGPEYEVCKIISSNAWAAKFIEAFEMWASTE